MIIEIDDKIDGKERRRLTLVLQILYAHKIFDGNRKEICHFLGFSIRWLRKQIVLNPELFILKKSKTENQTIFYQNSLKRWR